MKNEFLKVQGFTLQENMNKVIGSDYSADTQAAMAKLSEKEMSFELIEVNIFLIHLM